MKRAGNKRRRKVGVRELRFPRILIITEGTETEINYFQGIKNAIQQCYQKQLIIEKVDIELEGTGRGTMEVVQAALKRRNRNTYSEVWVLFDKDDFTDFDEAITFAIKNDLEVGWSNKSFELWLVLHFQEVTAPLDNDQYRDILNKFFKKENLCGGIYKKEEKRLFQALQPFVMDAIKRCHKRFKQLEERHVNIPSQSDPATRVYVLVEKLIPYIK